TAKALQVLLIRTQIRLAGRELPESGNSRIPDGRVRSCHYAQTLAYDLRRSPPERVNEIREITLFVGVQAGLNHGLHKNIVIQMGACSTSWLFRQLFLLRLGQPEAGDETYQINQRRDRARGVGQLRERRG